MGHVLGGGELRAAIDAWPAGVATAKSHPTVVSFQVVASLKAAGRNDESSTAARVGTLPLWKYGAMAQVAVRSGAR